METSGELVDPDIEGAAFRDCVFCINQGVTTLIVSSIEFQVPPIESGHREKSCLIPQGTRMVVSSYLKEQMHVNGNGPLNTPNETVGKRGMKQSFYAKRHTIQTPNETGFIRQMNQTFPSQVAEIIGFSGALPLYLNTHVLGELWN